LSPSRRQPHKPSPSRNAQTRNLAALEKTGSTSRVLNLVAVSKTHGSTPEYSEQPFFKNKVLNKVIILKHRLRADDRFNFDVYSATATKVILPFECGDLSLGGQSFFIGQRGWADLLYEACNDADDLARDIEVLRIIDGLPSLDPFLLRESLRVNGYLVAPCYFAISPADLLRMQAYVGQAVSQLVKMALGSSDFSLSVSRLVEALLSTEVDERLEPMRATLMLEGDRFREGVFSWKGFLYYKWALSELASELKTVSEEIGKLTITGPRDKETSIYIESSQKRLSASIQIQKNEVMRTLKIYDEAFKSLTSRNEPHAFRDFLLKAPELFLSLGEKIGVISHISSFWRYRFPKGRPPTCSVEEAVEILRDFEYGLGATLSC
jgi:hypothetical protein